MVKKGASYFRHCNDIVALWYIIVTVMIRKHVSKDFPCFSMYFSWEGLAFEVMHPDVSCWDVKRLVRKDAWKYVYIYIWHLKIYIYIFTYKYIYIYVYQMFFSWISQVIAGNFSAFICFNIFLAFFCQVISKQISPKKNDEECLYPRSVRNASRWSSKMASASSFHRPQNPFVLHEHFGREIDRLVKRMGILLNFSWLIFDLLLQPHASLLPKRISACHPKVFGL